jgi:RimJ/RimL family protein N-acetyltransferase
MPSLVASGALIRELRKDEFHTYSDLFVNLDPESRRNRFCGALSDSCVAEHTRRAWDTNVAIFGYFVSAELRGVSELHPFDLRDTAEAVFAVHQGFRRRGIGTALLHVTMLAAQRHGYRTITIACLRHNFAMRRLAQKVGAKLMLTLDEIEGEITVSQGLRDTPTHLSLLDARPRDRAG